MFKGKNLLRTGGTGSFGKAVLERFLDTDIGEIRIFSRDEKKQYDLLRHNNNPKIKCFVGDVRDMASLRSAMKGVDYVFHAAALKQVPSCEAHPMEAIKTNVLGTDNVMTAAVNDGVQKVICLSTDKAAYPVSAMGATKMLMEKLFTARVNGLSPGETSICGTRFGNVMASRGSVIPLFVELIKARRPLTITHPEMTRFVMDVYEAIDLVMFAFEFGESGDIMVQKAPACTTQTLAQALLEVFDAADTEIEIIGVRHGEAMYETLLTKEEAEVAVDLGKFYRIPLNKKVQRYEKYCEPVEDDSLLHINEFTSKNTLQLDIEQMKAKLLSLNYIKKELKKWHNKLKFKTQR